MKSSAQSGAVAPRIRFTGFERGELGCLRAVFRVVVADDPPFSATVHLDRRSGIALGLHCSAAAEYDGPTTGDPDLDVRLVETAQDELARARAVLFVSKLDRSPRR
jgi:hypothetical protein